MSQCKWILYTNLGRDKTLAENMQLQQNMLRNVVLRLTSAKLKNGFSVENGTSIFWPVDYHQRNASQLGCNQTLDSFLFESLFRQSCGNNFINCIEIFFFLIQMFFIIQQEILLDSPFHVWDVTILCENCMIHQPIGNILRNKNSQ